MPALFVVLGLAGAWILWRHWSRRALLPCPSELSWMVELQNPLARATRSEHILAQLAPQPGDRVLDLGCGPGRLTIPLARAVGPEGEVIALDPSNRRCSPKWPPKPVAIIWPTSVSSPRMPGSSNAAD